jgi:hypothetical protein
MQLRFCASEQHKSGLDVAEFASRASASSAQLFEKALVRFQRETSTGQSLLDAL